MVAVPSDFGDIDSLSLVNVVPSFSPLVLSCTTLLA